MDFKLNEDQIAFADSAKALFADFCSDDQQKAHDESGAPMMTELWQQCLENGLASIVLPEDNDGLGLGITELFAVLKEQGAALAHVPLWQHQLGAACIARFGSDALKTEAMENASTGESIVSVALSGLIAPSTLPTASLSGGSLTLNGIAEAVAFGAQAEYVVVAISLDKKVRLAVVKKGTNGVSVEDGFDHKRTGVANLRFSNASVAESKLLADDAERWLEPRAIAAMASLQYGVATEHLRRTVEYVTERKQFGRPIGTFQLVQGRMADCQMSVDALHATLAQLIYRLDAGLSAYPQCWSVRYLACECGHLTGHVAQHVHGGIGVDITYPIHRYGLWSRALNNAHGGVEQSLAALGNWMADNNQLGWKYDLEENTIV